MEAGASAFGDFARQRAVEQATAVSAAELEQYNRDRQNAEAEDAKMFEYMQAIVQPETPAPGQASVPMMPGPTPPPRAPGFGASQVPPPPMGGGMPGFTAGPQVPGAPPPGPFAPPGGMPPGLGLPPGMPPPPPGAPAAPAMPPPGWKGPSPAASPAMGGPAGGGGSPAVGASPVAAGTAPPAGLPTSPQMAMPPGIGAAPQAAAGVPGMIPPKEEPLPGVEQIKPIPVADIYAKISADTKLSPTQKYHVMAKVLHVANQQNDDLLKKMEARSYVANQMAQAGRAAAQEWRARQMPQPKQGEVERIEDELAGMDDDDPRRAGLEARVKYLTEHPPKKGASGGGGGAAGGGKETGMELIYPKGKNGLPDQTQNPIGSRGFDRNGKLIVKDLDGNVTSMAALGGGTPKEGKAGTVTVANATRQNLVKSGVTNSLSRLDEIEKKYPNSNTSIFFGQSAENPMSRGAYGVGRGQMSSDQKMADAAWSSMIDEAIPVFTGGLRGSDAFRRFLIEQAPGPGDDKKSRAEKIRLLRANINGTSKAFFNKFANDPTFWSPGTSPADIEAVKEGGGGLGGEPGTGEGVWKVEKVGK